MRLAPITALLLLLSLPARPQGEDAGAVLVREHSNSLVFVEDQAGAGSGFVAQLGAKKFVITNQHVVAGHPGITFTLLDRTPLKVGTASAAVAHDVMSFASLSDAKAMTVLGDLEKNAFIGDDVAVLGNPEGARVIKPLLGKLVGIGPNLVEITADFVPGNSGSPIIHLKTGKVIGVATYVTVGEDFPGRKNTERIRRFGYRLDSVKQWQSVTWPVYHEEQAQLDKIEARTRDLASLLKDLGDDGRIKLDRHQSPALKPAVEKFQEVVRHKGVTAPDRARAVKDFMAAMRSACNSDIEQARRRLRFDYFQRLLAEETQVRAEFAKIFNEMLQSQ